MTESKVSLDEAVKHFSNTLNSHAESLLRIEKSITSLKADYDNQVQQLQNTTRNDLQKVESNLTDLVASKTGFLTQVTDDVRSLKTDIMDLQTMLARHPNVPTHPHNPITPLRTELADPILSTPAPPTPTHHTSESPASLEPWPNHIPRSIVLPPTSSIPTFSGKPTERPRQFLLRIQEYTQTVNHWSHEVLLRGISQYLKDDALEWYCQLHSINKIPNNWNDFVVRFLAQFHSPIRAAQQEQAWTDCKQLENETINQFVVRLRSIWLEQKPEEIEADFTKHLFCKMRPDMLNLMNFSRSSTLDAIISEAQKVEEILFLRNKEQRQRDSQHTKSIFVPNHLHSPTSSATFYSSINNTKAPPLMDGFNNSRSSLRTPQRQPHTQTGPLRNIVTCWRCYETGHYSSQCPLNAEQSTAAQHVTSSTNHYSSQVYSPRQDYSYQPLPPRTKND
jgi:Retrotransposon gag protein